MSETIYAEFNTFCYAIMLGAFCGIIYDVIRIFRRIIKKKLAVTAAEDIIYWFVVSVLMFMLMYRENGGMVRGYAIIGMALGMILYEISIGKFFVKYVSKFLNYILNKILKVLKFILKKVLKPFKMIVRLYCDKNAKYKKKHEERKKQKEIEKQKVRNKKEDREIRQEKKGKAHEGNSEKDKSRKRNRKKKRKRQSD